MIWLRHLPSGDLEVHMLDVGQGDAFVLRLPSGTTLLIDGGSTSENRIDENVIEPFLNFMGIEEIDMAFVSHMDEDHMNGAVNLACSGMIRQMFFSCASSEEKVDAKIEIMEELSRLGVGVRMIGEGDSYTDESGVMLTCVYPFAPDAALTFPAETADSVPVPVSAPMLSDENDTSLVLLLQYGDFSMLLTGDSTMESDAAVIQSLSEMGIDHVDVLKVAHHGSNGSTSAELLEYLTPRVGMISCGRHNRYGHPGEEALARLASYGVGILRTDEVGWTELIVGESGVIIMSDS